MNLQTAQRLLEYRKSSGLSQEELAERIGVSRQAVSKWERGEASPDTDNLIALSEVYGVTLDELIKGKPETASENTENSVGDEHDSVHVSFKNGIDVVDAKKGDRVHVSWNGVHVESGNSKVHVDKNGVYVKDENGEIFDNDKHIFSGKHDNKTVLHNAFSHFPYPILTVIAYIVFGCVNVCGGWAYGWLVFLTVPLYYTLVIAIFYRNASHFAYPVLVALVYLYLGFAHTLWHPMWILFLTIPIYYFFCEFFKKLIAHNKS